MRKAAEPPRCAALARAGLGYFLPKADRGSARGKGSYGAWLWRRWRYESRDGERRGALPRRNGFRLCGPRTYPYLGKKGFVRAIVQSGTKRYSKLPDVPTIYELMDIYHTPEATKRLAKVMLSSGELGRPFIGPPEMPSDRVRMLRDAFARAMEDPALLAAAQKKKWDLDPLGGAELEAIAKEIMVQPARRDRRHQEIFGSIMDRRASGGRRDAEIIRRRKIGPCSNQKESPGNSRRGRAEPRLI